MEVGVGAIRIFAGLLLIIQVPAAQQYHETTLSDLLELFCVLAAGVAVGRPERPGWSSLASRVVHAVEEGFCSIYLASTLLDGQAGRVFVRVGVGAEVESRLDSPAGGTGMLGQPTTLTEEQGGASRR